MAGIDLKVKAVYFVACEKERKEHEEREREHVDVVAGGVVSSKSELLLLLLAAAFDRCRGWKKLFAATHSSVYVWTDSER